MTFFVLHEAASTLEHGIWGHLDLCSCAMVQWLQNELLLSPFQVKIMFF